MSIKDTVKNATKKAKRIVTGKSITQGRLYDYSTVESREEGIPWLYEYAKSQRSQQTAKWIELDDYYNNLHRTQLEILGAAQEKGAPFIPAIVPDPYIHVESQIIPDIPDFEFSGRDDDLDSSKAKQREYVVRYVVESNKVEAQNTDNERQLGKLGNAFWKVAWNGNIEGPGYTGDIEVGAPDCSNIFPDPSALDLDDCEFIAHSYRLHKMKIARMFARDLERLGMSIYDIGVDGRYADTEIYNSQVHDVNDDTMQIIEFWFRQPEAGSDTREYEIGRIPEKGYKKVSRKVEWEAGDIACSIIIGTKEVRYIPKYWEKTGKQNKRYPFVKYCKIPVAKSFWDKSEIEPIKDLVDAADREFSTALLNDAFMGNDIIVMEENALSDDGVINNMPGGILSVKDGKRGGVERLGGLGNLNGGLKDTVTFIRELIKETVGNFDVQQGGGPPSNVKTLGGLVELRQQGERRQSLKKADRTAGFQRLYELIDWTALEFYDDNRIIFLGAEGDVQDQQQIKANGMMSQEQQIEFAEQQQLAQQQGQQLQPPNMDRKKGPVVFKFDSGKFANKDGYYPRVDVNVQVGDGITHSKAFTLSATETIANMGITVENYKIVCEMIDIMQLPNRKDIKQYLENFFANQQMGIPKTSISFKDLPPDGKVQMAAKVGMQIQQPPEEDAQMVPWDILAQNPPNVNGRVPLQSQVQGGQMQGTDPQQSQMLQQILQQANVHLTPEELQRLEQNPEVLQHIIAQGQGAQPQDINPIHIHGMLQQLARTHPDIAQQIAQLPTPEAQYAAIEQLVGGGG